MAGITIARIVEAVAAEHHVAPEALVLPSDCPGARQRCFAWPRQEAMALSRDLVTTPHCDGEHRIAATLPMIGRKFGGRDHATVIHACRAVAERRRTDPEVHRRLVRLTRELIGGR